MVEEKCAHCGAQPIDPARPPYCSKLCLKRAGTKRWREARGPEYAREYGKRWRAANPEKQRETNRRNYQRNRAARIAYQCKYAKEHREVRQRQAQAARKTSGYLGPIWLARARAEKLKLPFNLTKEWGRARWTARCELTGLPFLFTRGAGPRMYSPTIDRVIPELGYVQSNCRFVLHAVNALKSTGTDAEMLKIAEAIVRTLRSTRP